MAEDLDTDIELETDPQEAPEVPAVDVMAMSDEDFAKLPEPTDEPAEDQEVPVVEPDAADPGADKGDEKEGDVSPEPTDTDKPVDASDVEKPVDAEGKADKKEDPVTDVGIDYKAEYEKLTAPFKANGVDIKIQSADEAIQLMQMGANYHKKMSSLKPSMKIVKLLERNDLLDESKLGYLIDLNKKDPAAITKLIKESGIDPLSMDMEAESTYKPTTKGISNTELELDEVLDSIKDTPTYAQTLKVVSEEWDDTSRQAVAGKPQILSVINEHIADGTYAKVFGEVQRARVLGKLTGVSDLDAYKMMGDYLYSQKPVVQSAAPVAVNANDTAQKKAADDAKRKAAKQAASITRGKISTPVKPKNSPLSLSDDEFDKLPATAYTQL